MTPEEGLRLLWCNVLFRMIEDASYSLGSTSVASDLEIEQAREWILVPNRDFEIACQLAGYEADRIRAKVKPLIEAAQKLDGSSEAISPRKRQSRPRLVKHTTRKPRQRGELFEHQGRRLTLKQWAQQSGISYGTLDWRISEGWTIERALKTPIANTRPKRADRKAA
jgi:hypothetical protein